MNHPSPKEQDLKIINLRKQIPSRQFIVEVASIVGILNMVRNNPI
jgi:hypothetical protein